ncbi:MAG: hypothetical protein CMI52_00500 [Parcubacteria group bacterium]|nr:hypothetical protein [Parcubacteria group bacterium]|tara:strand:- start:84 stop:401 length:318 start_codon:yes stop_codon:yes gene_type:complete
MKHLGYLIFVFMLVGAGCGVNEPVVEILAFDDPRSADCHIEQCHPDINDISCGSQSTGECLFFLSKGDVCNAVNKGVGCGIIDGECVLVGMDKYKACMDDPEMDL